jgi:hypothetical protein
MDDLVHVITAPVRSSAAPALSGDWLKHPNSLDRASLGLDEVGRVIRHADHLVTGS